MSAAVDAPAAASPGGGEATFARGAGWLAGATVLIGLVNYGFTVGMTHLLTTSGFSTFAAGQALVLTAGTVAANSGAWVLAHSLVEASTPLERHRATWFSVALNTAVGVLGGSVAALVALSFAPPAAAALVGACVLLVFLACVTAGLLRGQLRFSALGGVSVAEALVKLGVGVGVVALGAGALGALGGIAAGSLVVVAVGVAIGRRDLLPVGGSLRSGGLWRHAASATGVQGAVAVLGSVDTVVVAAVISDPDGAAAYQAAMALSRIPLFLAGAVAASVHPLVVRDPEGSGPVVQQAVRMYLAVTLPFAVALACAPEPLLDLVLPPHYVHRLVPLLPFTAAAGAVVGAVALVATVMLSRGEAVRSTRAQAAGLVVLVAALGLGTALAGTAGAAVAVLVGSVASLAALVVAVPAGWRASLAVPRRELLLAALAVVVLLAVREEVWVWLAAAALAGGVGVLRAFGGSRPPAPSAAPDDGGGAPVLELPEGARLVVVSPHLDDAALSCGELLSQPGAAARAVVLTLFTECSRPHTASAHAYLRQCGVRTRCAAQLYSRRRSEDAAVLEGLGTRWVHAGLEDALFRKLAHPSRVLALAGRLLPELLHVYPTYRWHVARGRVGRRDAAVVVRVGAALDAELAREGAHGPVVLLAPLGVGGHVDHVLARDAARDAGMRWGVPVLHYADVPYSLEVAPDVAFTARHALREVPLGGSGRAKRALVQQYATQSAALFPDGAPELDDVYYAPAELLAGGSR